jgi:archaellum biogenesis ATPase FlaH
LAAFTHHSACDKCGSSNNLANYSDGSFHCFTVGCSNTKPSQEHIDEQELLKGKSKRKKLIKENMDEPIKSTKPVIDPDDAAEIKQETSTNPKGFRGLNEETCKYFGVRHSYNQETGLVEEQYYPCTQEGQLTGYKVRVEPKDFYSKGRTGADTELFGQFRFNRGGKYVLLVEGELDTLSAYMMLKEYNTSKGSDFETAVVSATTGANSKKQLAAQYKFLDSFDNVVVCYDNDKAGKDATDQIVKVLPKGKVKIMQMRLKDPNEYLTKGEQKKFIQDFYNAKKPVPVGVLPSDQLYDRIIGQSGIAKVPFPDFMGELNEMFVGGMPLGHIINVAADTGVGKTTLVNEMVYFWAFHSPHLIGVVSMELDAGQYGEVLLSRHLSKKLALIPSQEEKLEYLKSDRIKTLAQELMTNEKGNARFYLLDNRDGTVEEIQETIEELVVACGCKVIILDPLQDILDGLSNEEQALFMKWAKGFIKSHGVTFVFINHMRKSTDSGEQDIMGSSTIIKSASANILLKRDKLADDAILRNTTQIQVTKNRICGLTGPAGNAYYDNETHRLHNLTKWMEEHS